MKDIVKSAFFAMFILTFANADFDESQPLTTGEKVFRAYCWGCHHQTSTAFGPSFEQIASTRTKDQMITHIMSPKSDYKQLGYRRSVMPSFGDTLNPKELDLITNFILSFKKGN
jgi:mono/diheme cytochrome c family protein